MIRAQGVLKPGVSGAGINQKCVAELTNITKALEGLGIEHRQRLAIDLDVIPDGVPDDFERSGPGVIQDPGPAERTSSET